MENTPKGKRSKTRGTVRTEEREHGALDPGGSIECGAQYSDSGSISKVSNVY